MDKIQLYRYEDGKEIGIPIRDILAELNKHILRGEDELSISDWNMPKDATFLDFEYRWIACYAVRGDSDGWYVHVDLITGYDLDSGWCGKVVAHLLQGKCWDRDAAVEVASICSKLLEV